MRRNKPDKSDYADDYNRKRSKERANQQKQNAFCIYIHALHNCGAFSLLNQAEIF